MLPPPRSSGGGARGPEGPPHSPPPLPLRPKSGRRQTEETAAPHPPRRGRCYRGAGAPRPRQAPARPARCRPTADRRRPGRRKRSGPFRGRPGEDGGANQGGGVPPLPPRRTDPLAADRTAPDARGRPATPSARVYPGAGTPETTDCRPTPDGPGGRPPLPPPCPPPPSLGATGATLRPPGAEGAPPLPQKGPRRGGGGMRLDLHTARPSAPSRLLLRGSRPTGKPTPARRNNARTKLGGGARRRTRTVLTPRPP